MLNKFFTMNNKAAICFSGGVDSSYLFYEALKHHAQVTAYYVKTEFQPEFELRDAVRLASDIGGKLEIIYATALKNEKVLANDELRCYYCKTAIMSRIVERAALDGYSLLLDGCNASDNAGDRPGMKAAYELGVRSPLREADLTKNDVRRLSREAGLFVWNKPSYSCLATRIATGMRIDAETLAKIERGEGILFSLGFSDFRLRVRDDGILLQLRAEQLEKARKMWHTVCDLLGADYAGLRLDTVPRQGENIVGFE